MRNPVLSAFIVFLAFSLVSSLRADNFVPLPGPARSHEKTDMAKMASVKTEVQIRTAASPVKKSAPQFDSDAFLTFAYHDFLSPQPDDSTKGSLSATAIQIPLYQSRAPPVCA